MLFNVNGTPAESYGHATAHNCWDGARPPGGPRMADEKLPASGVVGRHPLFPEQPDNLRLPPAVKARPLAEYRGRRVVAGTVGSKAWVASRCGAWAKVSCGRAACAGNCEVSGEQVGAQGGRRDAGHQAVRAGLRDGPGSGEQCGPTLRHHPSGGSTPRMTVGTSAASHCGMARKACAEGTRVARSTPSRSGKTTPRLSTSGRC